MSDMNEYTPDLFELIDEDGNKKQFEMIDAVELDGEQYYAMMPFLDEGEVPDEDNLELVILKSVYENDEEILASIEDDEEYFKVGAYFMKRMEEAMDDFEDEENE